jgi:hypothetical protein
MIASYGLLPCSVAEFATLPVRSFAKILRDFGPDWFDLTKVIDNAADFERDVDRMSYPQFRPKVLFYRLWRSRGRLQNRERGRH